MAKKKETVPAALLDIREAQQAFERLAAKLKQLADGKLHPVRVDLQLAAAVVYSIALRDNTNPRRARFVSVAQVGVFDIAVLDGLPTMALAAWHVRRMQVQTMQAASVARVTEAHLKEAQLTRGRMLRVLTYYYEDHEEHGKRIDAIRAGTGYLDLANDLIALAAFYELPDVAELITRDPLHYRKDDPAQARGLAQNIFCGLGLIPEGDASRWNNLAQRAWTLLNNDYEVLRATGQLVFRNDEDVTATYPSLVTAVRARATRNSPTLSAAVSGSQAGPPGASN